MERYVYHASTQKGLTKLYPRKSTHGEYVYATNYIGIAAAYLGRWSDFDLAQGIKDERLFLVERYQGALEKIYSGKSGSIYKMSKDGFLEDKTPFSGGEVVNPNEVDILEELPVDDSYHCIKSLIENGDIDFYKFPSRPNSIPSNDFDIIEKAARWIKLNPNGKAYSNFIDLHPHLKSELDSQLGINPLFK